ncbi:toll-like receptor 4 [Mercenaria mercenaria]|uniref:toll-like receptor 4 n=1 Tax=Mercenaria mercenaria TaxID=6596 RepID=UPI00234F66F0|nr:toll-like receptor 4 [Mercenaria mercenaria]
MLHTKLYEDPVVRTKKKQPKVFNGASLYSLQGLRVAGLKKIVLSHWNLYRGTYAFDDNLVEALLPRNITNIDISISQVSDLNLTSLEKFKYIEVLNASYATISDFHDTSLSADVAKHLQVFDLFHAVLPKQVLPFPPGKLTAYNTTLVFSRTRFWDYKKMFAPKTVNYSGIVPHLTSFWLYNITIQIDIDPKWYTKTIKLQQNNIKRVDVRLLCDKFYFSAIQNLDISDNGMEFLHPTFLSCVPNLRHLHLSKNQLYKMVAEDRFLFQNLFSGLRYLKLIRLSANGLQKIPSKLFKNQQSIEVADLSFNKLEQVTFNLNDLENLKVLDLQGNNIHILDSLSINFLNSIPQESKIKPKPNVILRLNPILCSVCEAKPFIQWLISTSLINMDSQRLKCLDENGQHNDINVNTVEMVQKICEWKTVIISTSISAAVIFLILFSCAIIIYKRYKRKKKSQNRTNVINNLRDGDGKYQFAVFLSFNNEDEEFVHSHILEQLNENLQLMTGIDRTLVCTGD